MAQETVSPKPRNDPVDMDALAERTSDITGVERVEIQSDRTPPRLTLTLSDGEVPDGVYDLCDSEEIQGRLDEPRIDDGRLVVDFVPEESWKVAAKRKVYSFGNSPGLTLTRESLDLSGLALGDNVVQYARDGEILLRHD